MKKFLIKVNGIQYEVEVEEIGVSPQTNVNYAPAAPVAQAPQAKPAAPSPAPSPTPTPAPATTQKPSEPTVSKEVPAGAQTVNAPMPGVILDIKVSVGDSVKKGDVLLILEAMKMENEIVAPTDGTVASINVSKGASVNAGDVLVSLK